MMKHCFLLFEYMYFIKTMKDIAKGFYSDSNITRSKHNTNVNLIEETVLLNKDITKNENFRRISNFIIWNENFSKPHFYEFNYLETLKEKDVFVDHVDSKDKFVIDMIKSKPNCKEITQSSTPASHGINRDITNDPVNGMKLLCFYTSSTSLEDSIKYVYTLEKGSSVFFKIRDVLMKELKNLMLVESKYLTIAKYKGKTYPIRCSKFLLKMYTNLLEMKTSWYISSYKHKPNDINVSWCNIRLNEHFSFMKMIIKENRLDKYEEDYIMVEDIKKKILMLEKKWNSAMRHDKLMRRLIEKHVNGKFKCSIPTRLDLVSPQILKSFVNRTHKMFNKCLKILRDRKTRIISTSRFNSELNDNTVELLFSDLERIYRTITYIKYFDVLTRSYATNLDDIKLFLDSEVFGNILLPDLQNMIKEEIERCKASSMTNLAAQTFEGTTLDHRDIIHPYNWAFDECKQILEHYNRMIKPAINDIVDNFQSKHGLKQQSSNYENQDLLVSDKDPLFEGESSITNKDTVSSVENKDRVLLLNTENEESKVNKLSTLLTDQNSEFVKTRLGLDSCCENNSNLHQSTVKRENQYDEKNNDEENISFESNDKHISKNDETNVPKNNNANSSEKDPEENFVITEKDSNDVVKANELDDIEIKNPSSKVNNIGSNSFIQTYNRKILVILFIFIFFLCLITVMCYKVEQKYALKKYLFDPIEHDDFSRHYFIRHKV